MIKGMAVSDNAFEQVQAVLDLINNKDLYEKRLKELDKKKKDLVKLVKVVGNVKDIDTLLHQAETLKAKALKETEVLLKKQAVADELITEAKKRAEVIQTDSFALNSEQHEALDNREKNLKAFEKSLQVKQHELSTIENKLLQKTRTVDAELDRLEQLKQNAETMRLEYMDRKSQIDSALSGL